MLISQMLFKLCLLDDFVADTKFWARFEKPSLELLNDGFMVSNGRDSVGIREFMGMIFIFIDDSEHHANTSRQIASSLQGEARQLFDEVVDQLLAA